MSQKEWRLLYNPAVKWPEDVICIFYGIPTAINEGLVGNTMYVARPTQYITNVGYFQDIEKDMNLDYCVVWGYPCIRRPVGGGSIVVSPIDSIVFLYLDDRDPIVPKSREEQFNKILGGVVTGLKDKFGLADARIKPLNDIDIGPKKLMASSIEKVGEHCLEFEATIPTEEFPTEIADNLFPYIPEKMADKATKTAAERVTYLNKEVGREVSLEEMRDLYAYGIEKAFGIKFVLGELIEREKEVANALVKQFITVEWTFGNTEKRKFGEIPKDVVRAEFRHKAVAGLMRAVTLTKSGVIENIHFSGDFVAEPATVIAEMEQALKGAKVNENEVRERIRKVLDRPGVEIPQATLDDFVTTVMGAVKQAQ